VSGAAAGGLLVRVALIGMGRMGRALDVLAPERLARKSAGTKQMRMVAAAMTQSIQEMFMGRNLAIGAPVGNASRRVPMAEPSMGPTLHGARARLVCDSVQRLRRTQRPAHLRLLSVCLAIASGDEVTIGTLITSNPARLEGAGVKPGDVLEGRIIPLDAKKMMARFAPVSTSRGASSSAASAWPRRRQVAA
jgi:hypothetical protein